MNKKNSYDYKKILILISLMIIFSLSFITNNIYTNKNGYFDNPNDDTIKELENKNLKSQDLTSDNVYNGIGAAWNLTHWANRTDNNLEVSFENNSYDIKNMPLDIDWIGYKLNATIKDLYDKRNWVNGTFHAGPDDNNPSCPENDSIYLQNWTFGEYDDTSEYSNDMSGNYFDINHDPSGTSNDCLELRMNGGGVGNAGYDKYDRCWWESNFTLPRGKAIEGEINLVIYPYTQYEYIREFGTHWSVQVILNGIVIDDKNLIWLEDSGGGDWYPLKLQLTNWLDDPTVFPDNEKNMSLRIQLIRNGPTFSHGPYGTYQEVLFDNVSLIVKAETKPTQIGLNMNQTPVSNSTNWGEGTVEINGNWNGTQYPWVHANFNSSKIWPSELGGYNITFKTDLNLFANKSSPETNYETNTASLGTSFSVSNDSLVNWECYGYTSVPTGYAETEMRLEFPTDVNITWISYPSDPLTNKLKLDLCDNSTAGLLIVNVSKISETPDGFWKFEALSPNYCEQLNIENTEFLSGEYINISAVITNNSLISDYIQATKATLQIRFPNGTIWSDKTQEKNPIANGSVYFEPILIPPTAPAYEVGEYDAIITWNNSHSIYGLNETGIIYKKFTVIHNSILEPEQSSYYDVFEGEILNLKVSFNDKENGDAIENAIVYLYNFTGGLQYFSEISPGYYFLEFNVSGAIVGNNTLTIYANSSLYENNKVNISIEVILATTLTADKSFLSVPWGQNFTIQFNYTEKYSRNGIASTPTSNWIGESHIIPTALGEYNITCNTSAYQVNQLHSLIIEVDEVGYESQSILIKIEVSERETDMDVYLNQTLQTAIVFPYDEVLNITAIYKDLDTGNFIDGATVLLKDGETVIGTLSKHATLDQYYLLKNTADFGIGVNSLSIYAKKDNYSVSLVSITITITERETDILLFINETDITDTKTYQIQIGQIINITVKYKDEQTGAHIEGALVEITGGDISDNLTENSLLEYYNITLSSENFTKGYNFLTITAEMPNYQFQYISFTIELIERQTNLTLFVNQTDITDTLTYQIQIGETINITIKYTDMQTTAYIGDALVEITGGDISANLTENPLLEYYNITLSSENFTKGINFLTITAELTNYQFQYISFTIELIERQTNLKVFLNDTFTTNFELTFGEYINITVEFQDNKTGAHIEGALVAITGGNISANLMENSLLGQYYIIISAANLTEGYNFLTISAERENYQFQYISLTIELIERETYMKLYLNGTPTTSFEVIFGEFIYITVEYRDNETDEFIDSSLVKLIGEGISLNLMKHPSLNQYIAIINTEDLGIGIKSLTISAKKEKYEVSSMVLTISITYRGTYSILFLNEINKTLDKSIELPIGANLNITFKFMNTETEEFIDLALVQLVGADKTWNFTENTILKQYILIISSRELNIGINFLTIFARKTNYESSTVLLKITVRQIITNITTETGEDIINIQAGDSIHLKITLKDLDFDRMITNATIKYIWDLGQGYIIDDNKDGIYELILNNIQAGTFTIYFTVVNVSADYLFETKVITITSIPKQEDTFLITLLLGVSIVGIIALSSYFVAYQRVLKFPLPVRKIHKFKKTLKKKKSPDVEIITSNDSLKTIYEEHLAPIAKLLKGKIKPKLSEQQPEQKPLKDNFSETLSEKLSDDSEKKEI